ncbi:MAG: cobalamin-dependent protein [Rickettsia endosymbiont of Ixodes persulcatus]|nr:cobalamin-dependent protein [Rickettsia endosymbiont of Ixodes persulcatus]
MKRKILISSISSDSHTWNLVYMQLLVEEMGHEAINIGNCVQIDHLIKQAHYHKPDILVISTVNGHGHIEGVEIVNEIKKYDMLKHMEIVIGGKLGTLGNENQSYVQKLLDAGFDKVFWGDKSVDDFIVYLRDVKTQMYLVQGRN